MLASQLHAFIDQFEGLTPEALQSKTLLRSLADLPDPRARRGIRHPLAHILVIIICAVITGAKTLVEITEWAKGIAPHQLAGYGIEAPHASSIARVLQLLDIQSLSCSLLTGPKIYEVEQAPTRESELSL